MQARRRSRLRSPYLWHRWLGLAAAIPLFIAALTGLALNHTEDLGLDQRHLDQDWLLDWYGIRPPGEALGFPLEGRWLTWLGGQLFLDRHPVDDSERPPVGAVLSESAGLLVVALPDALRLYTPEGERVEELPAGVALPGHPLRLGITADGAIVLETGEGRFVADEALLQWSPATGQAVQWSGGAPPPPALAQALERAWRGQGLPLERVVLDLHSGRILGGAGVLIMDAAAVLVLLLAPTGVYLWIRARRRQREHRRKHPPR